MTPQQIADIVAWLRCRLTRQHTPMLTWGHGQLYLRCPSCQLRTDGVQIEGADTAPLQHVVRTTIRVF